MSGKDNIVADALSHVAEVNILGTIDFSVIAEAQKDDADFQSLSTNYKHTFREFLIFGSTFIMCDFREGTKVVFHAIHDLAQPGIQTRNRLSL